jgi:hypothetical protein
MKYALACSSINGNRYGIYFTDPRDFDNWLSYGEISNLFKRADIVIQDLTTIVYVNSFKKLRWERDLILKSTDYTQLADVPIDNKLKNFYRMYRKYLRDLPKNYTEDSVHNARVMNFVEWKQWFYPEH